MAKQSRAEQTLAAQLLESPEWKQLTAPSTDSTSPRGLIDAANLVSNALCDLQADGQLSLQAWESTVVRQLQVRLAPCCYMGQNRMAHSTLVSSLE